MRLRQLHQLFTPTPPPPPAPIAMAEAKTQSGGRATVLRLATNSYACHAFSAVRLLMPPPSRFFYLLCCQASSDSSLPICFLSSSCFKSASEERKNFEDIRNKKSNQVE
ncbi:hypothetical protein Bca52824_065278 [Brassica carinata]|uniref:Uncharacterized protein n=1 Tax=Brassica carinata TaxID=52824 RepID=A0A8X7QN47_BRACI|nr:hypothetical protein Bca52824_065278 [Brassica carinata]